ncbi:ABC transporter permease [Lichenihabitans psoromatis]|uniref:ABC transporter permease n=1 Tax=Lichenihabitans psoromatis TaxID=2528642 RepID=UPI0010384FF3|nr:ABC transporter permease [Lichenihabitans psoromatis]
MRTRALLMLPGTAVLATFFGAFAIFAGVSVLHTRSGTPGYAAPVTLTNYALFLGDASALGTLAHTLIFSLVLTAASIALGYPTAYLIARARSRPGRTALLGALILTFLSGSISRAYGWLLLLGKRGMVNHLLLSAGLIDRPLSLIYNSTGVFIALLHFTLPYFALTVLGSIRNVPLHLEEAARDLGAKPLTVFFRITVPLTMPAVVNGAALVFSLGISAFVFPLLLGGGRVRLISNFIYDQLFVAFDLPFAAASSAIFLTVALGALLFFVMLERLLVRKTGAR